MIVRMRVHSFGIGLPNPQSVRVSVQVFQRPPEMQRRANNRQLRRWARRRRCRRLRRPLLDGTAEFARSQTADHLHQIPDLTLRGRFAASEVFYYAEAIEE